MTDRALRALIGSLLIAAAALFAIGVAIEHHNVQAGRSSASRAAARAVLLLADADQGHESGIATSARPAVRASRERSHQRTERSGGEPPADESAAQVAREQHRERIFGINPDSTALVAVAVAVSVILAAMMWLRAGIYVPLAIAAFAIGATGFDAREVARQIGEHRTNLIVIASIVAALHLGAAVSALLLIRNRRTRIASPAPELSRA